MSKPITITVKCGDKKVKIKSTGNALKDLHAVARKFGDVESFENMPGEIRAYIKERGDSIHTMLFQLIKAYGK